MNQTLANLNKLEDLIKRKSQKSPTVVVDQNKETSRLANQAIASMRDSVNNNQAVMAEIVKRIAIRPKEFIIVRDGQQNMTKIIPVYE